MKTKKLAKPLRLKKQTVTHLSNLYMNSVKAGAITIVPVCTVTQAQYKCRDSRLTLCDYCDTDMPCYSDDWVCAL